MLLSPVTVGLGGLLLLLLGGGKKRKAPTGLPDFTMQPGVQYSIAADAKSGTAEDIAAFLAALRKEGAQNVGADGTFLSWDPPKVRVTTRVSRLWVRGRLVVEIIACAPSSAEWIDPSIMNKGAA